MHMAGKYPWNINRVGVKVDRGSKVNPRLLKTQTTIAINNFVITVVHISHMTNYQSFNFFHKT